MATEFNSSLEDARAFLDEHDITWPNAYAADESMDAFQVRGYPTTFVIGRDGTIRWNSLQHGRSVSLEEAIEAALAG